MKFIYDKKIYKITLKWILIDIPIKYKDDTKNLWDSLTDNYLLGCILGFIVFVVFSLVYTIIFPICYAVKVFIFSKSFNKSFKSNQQVYATLDNIKYWLKNKMIKQVGEQK